MKIDFYHVDAFETALYEPVWKKLRAMGVDARMVAVPGLNNTAAPGWFDYERCVAYCMRRGIPLHDFADPASVLAVTTQNADILSEYKTRIRLMYGPIVYPKAWGVQRHSVAPFDAVLVHGAAHHALFQQWLSPDRLPMVGYPRYDDFFAGMFNSGEIKAAWQADPRKKTIVFLPTWDNNTAFDQFFPYLCQLRDRYNILVRPHHCTLRLEPHRMEAINRSGFSILDDAFDLLSCIAGADVVVSDVRSGSLFEAVMCGTPSVGLMRDPLERTGWLAAEKISNIVSLCAEQNGLEAAIDHALSSQAQRLARQEWADRYVSHRNGDAATVAAESLIALAERYHQSRKLPKVTQDARFPVKVSIVLPTYNHAYHLPGAVHSILQQKMDDFELIIVNDGSTDHTQQMLEGFSHPKVKIITQDNKGLPAALNTGFSVARGQYWTWTSADNLVSPTWLEELCRALDNAPFETGYALSSYAMIDENDRIVSANTTPCFETWRMLLENGNASFLYRSDLARACGVYDVELNGAEDLDMWLRMSLLTRAIHVESILYYYRVHDDSMTARIPLEIRRATVKLLEKFVTTNGGLPIDQIFPNIAGSHNPDMARWQAKIWLSERLSEVESTIVQNAIVDLLVDAIEHRYDALLIANLVHILGRQGLWDRVTDFVDFASRERPSELLAQLKAMTLQQDRNAAAQLGFRSLAARDLSFSIFTQESMQKKLGLVA